MHHFHSGKVESLTQDHKGRKWKSNDLKQILFAHKAHELSHSDALPVMHCQWTHTSMKFRILDEPIYHVDFVVVMSFSLSDLTLSPHRSDSWCISILYHPLLKKA